MVSKSLLRIAPNIRAIAWLEEGLESERGLKSLLIPFPSLSDEQLVGGVDLLSDPETKQPKERSIFLSSFST